MSNGFSYIDLNSGLGGPLPTDGGSMFLDGAAGWVKLLVLPYRTIAADWNGVSVQTPPPRSSASGTQHADVQAPSPLVGENWGGGAERLRRGDRYAFLRTLCEHREKKRFHETEWTPEAGTFLLFTGLRNPEIDQLCQVLVRPPPLSGACLVFLHASAFRQLQDRVRYSANVLPSFLIRDDGALQENGANWLKSEINEREGWIGTSWLSAIQSGRCPETTLRCYDQLGDLINDECLGLCERHLLSMVKYSQVRPPRTEIEIRRVQVARLLSAYLPRYRELTDWNRLLPYGADATTGRLPLHGPAPWRNWNDQRLGELEQDLIFEGWLTPFPDKDNRWTLQPASLILLFWAARVMDLPFSADPDQFIRHHDWRNWFGDRCHWQSTPPIGQASP